MNNINNIDFNLYRIFLSVAKTGSISKAAEELFVSQPAVSYSIKTLENELNCKLFNRTSKGVDLTPEALRLLFYVENAYNTIYTGYKMLNDSKDLVYGDVRIGVPTQIGTFFVSNIIQKFSVIHPGIKFIIVNRSTDEMVKMLEKRDLDLIVDSFPIASERENINISELFEVDNCFAGNEKFKALLERKVVKMEEMANFPLLLPSKFTSTRKALERSILNKELDLESLVEVSTTEMMLDLVKKGVGIGYFARMSVEEEIRDGHIYEVPVDVELPKTKVCIAFFEDFLTSAPKEFISMLKREVDSIKNKSKKELRILVTQDCIYDCSFCHKEGVQNKKELLLDKDDISFLFKTANKSIGLKGVQITGGEPLCRKDIISIVKSLKEAGSRVTLTTNGYLLDEKQEVCENIDKLNISMHTLNKEEYENISNISGSFEKLMNNIKMIRAKYPVLNIGFNMTLIKNINSSFDEIENIINFAKSVKANLKIVELYDNRDPRFISVDVLKPLLEKNGYRLFTKTYRKEKYSNGKQIISLTRCSCSAMLKTVDPEKECKNNNDIFITQDGKARLCRKNDNEINIYDEIKNKDEAKLINKLELICDSLGKGCVCNLDEYDRKRI